MPEISLADFTLAQHDCLALVGNLVGEGLVTQMTRHDEGQPAGEMALTTAHALRVAALTELAARPFLSEGKRTRLVVAAFMHDVMKLFDPQINSIVHADRLLTPEDRLVLGTHAPRGGEFVLRELAGWLAPDLLNGVAFDVAHHHTPLDMLATAGSDTDAGYTTLLQTADVTDAVILDWTRRYKPERMLSEGSIDNFGQPVVETVTKKILNGKPETALGVPLRAIVDIAVPLLPDHMAISGAILPAVPRPRDGSNN